MRSRLMAAALAAAGIAAAATAVVADGHGAAAGRGEAIIAHASKYGTVIFTGQHRAVYLFARDHGRTSSCTGACAKAWPPVLTKGGPVAGMGTRASLLGTTRRRDGTTQVTYGGHPLYRFTGDKKAYEITCQNVSQFGGKWFVVTTAGRAVH